MNENDYSWACPYKRDPQIQEHVTKICYTITL